MNIEVRKPSALLTGIRNENPKLTYRYCSFLIGQLSRPALSKREKHNARQLPFLCPRHLRIIAENCRQCSVDIILNSAINMRYRREPWRNRKKLTSISCRPPKRNVRGDIRFVSVIFYSTVDPWVTERPHQRADFCFGWPANY